MLPSFRRGIRAAQGGVAFGHPSKLLTDRNLWMQFGLGEGPSIMRSDSLDEGTTRDLVAEMRAIVEETRRAIEASQAILDRCSMDCPEPGAIATAGAGQRQGEAHDLLGEISEGLIHAYGFAKRDGDILTVTLIEKALFHVGQRLARGLSAADVGMVCH